jgi:hypothetical protein
MKKYLMTSKTFPLLLVGVVMTLSACSNTSQTPNNPVSEATPAEVGKRPEVTSTTATDSSNSGKASSVSSSTSDRPNQTLRQKRSEAKASTAKAQDYRNNYKPISLSKLAKPDTLVGDDPKAIALSAFGDIQSEGGSREVTVDYPQSNQAIVTIIQTGVADDSIGAIKYRVELVTTPESASTGKQWKLVWVGSQVKCQPGRGHQDWAVELCL